MRHDPRARRLRCQIMSVAKLGRDGVGTTTREMGNLVIYTSLEDTASIYEDAYAKGIWQSYARPTKRRCGNFHIQMRWWLQEVGPNGRIESSEHRCSYPKRMMHLV